MSLKFSFRINRSINFWSARDPPLRATFLRPLGIATEQVRVLTFRLNAVNFKKMNVNVNQSTNTVINSEIY